MQRDFSSNNCSRVECIATPHDTQCTPHDTRLQFENIIDMKTVRESHSEKIRETGLQQRNEARDEREMKREMRVSSMRKRWLKTTGAYQTLYPDGCAKKGHVL